MYYGYSIPTPYGRAYCYTDEGNVPGTLPKGTLITLSNPLKATVDSKRVLIAYPVSNSPYVMGVEYGKTVMVPVDKLKALEGQVVGHAKWGAKRLEILGPDSKAITADIPIILGKPIARKDLPKNAKIRKITLNIPGFSPLAFETLLIILIYIIIVSAIIGMTYAATVIEKERTIQQANSYLFQSQEIVKEEEIDLNADGINDIKRTTFKNGDIISCALSDYGYSKQGNVTCKIEKEGWDGDDLANNIKAGRESDWDKYILYIIGGALAIGGVAVLYNMSKKKSS